MFQIDCPCCGVRPQNEFHCGGTSHIQRPPLACSDQAWGEYLFERANPRGMHAERWRHTYGCGQWFNALRDTVSHEITRVYPMGESMPAIAAVGVVNVQ